MKRILVPCDFSAPAQEAFKLAVKIALESKAELHVLHVLDITFLRGNPSLSHSYAFNLTFLTEMEQEADSKFQEMWEKYSPITLGVKFKYRIGTLVPDIENYIQEKNIDLVVMGTHGLSGGRLVGSTAEKIVRHSPVPVLTVRKAPEKDIKNIVFPVVPDQKQDQLIEEVKKLQIFFNAKLHLLWINTPLIFKNDPDAHRELQHFAADRFSNYTLNIRSDYNAESGISRFAEEIQADMICMGTHAWKGFAHLLIGSIAEDVVNHLNIPIWTYALENS